MSLQIQYSKELAKELGKIAVYLPGEQIEVGDIITFPYGRTGMFSKKVPFGSFKKLSSLKSLNVDAGTLEESGSVHGYKFSSKNSVNITTSAVANAAFTNENLPGTKGEIKLEFTSEGAIYFHAKDCRKFQINNVAALEKEIITKGKNLIWDNTYLVTSVTYAKKALIIQSISKSSEIIFEGDINGMKSTIATLSIDADMKIKSQNGDFFIKDWSDHVSVFMELMKFEKDIFQQEANRDLSVKQNNAHLIPVDIRTIIKQ